LCAYHNLVNHKILDVQYEYGDPSAGNQAGRITRQQDASGTQRFSYGKLGELITNERTFVMPGGSETGKNTLGSRTSSPGPFSSRRRGERNWIVVLFCILHLELQ
jgi:hypothetical protein